MGCVCIKVTCVLLPRSTFSGKLCQNTQYRTNVQRIIHPNKELQEFSKLRYPRESRDQESPYVRKRIESGPQRTFGRHGGEQKNREYSR